MGYHGRLSKSTLSIPVSTVTESLFLSCLSNNDQSSVSVLYFCHLNQLQEEEAYMQRQKLLEDMLSLKERESEFDLNHQMKTK